MISAKQLAKLNSQRKFKEVLELWTERGAAVDDHAKYQVFLAATALEMEEEAAMLLKRLPSSMQYDAKRDILLMQIRSGSIASSTAAHEQAFRLVHEAPDQDKLGIANMTWARLHRALGDEELAQLYIHRAWQCNTQDQTWRRNIAFWGLIIGGTGQRTRLLQLVVRDPAWSRRLVGVMCYMAPFAGRLLPQK